MAATKIYYILFLFFVCTSALDYWTWSDDIQDWVYVDIEHSAPTTESDGYTESMYDTTEYEKEKDGRYIQDQKNIEHSAPTTESDDYTESTYGTTKHKKEKDGSYAQDQKNLVTISRPALDGSYIQVYQKNEYHDNGDPARLVTVYRRCSRNGSCKDIHRLEIALSD